MGVTIHFKLEAKKNAVKDMLDRAEQHAKAYKQQAETISVPFSIKRVSDFSLFIDIGECETLAFNFKSKNEILEEKKRGYSYLYNTLTDNGKNEIDNGYKVEEFPQNEKLFASDFCKTQFAKSIVEHRFVAEIVRSVASYCIKSEVSDEGDYYYTGEIEDAKKAIYENGLLINETIGMLKTKEWKDTEIISGGETKIKPIKK